MTIDVCLAGATGWAGSELARGIAATSDLRLVAAVARKHAGKNLGDVLDDRRIAAPIHATAAEALARIPAIGPDVAGYVSQIPAAARYMAGIP